MERVSARVWAALVVALGVLFVGIGLVSSEGNPATAIPTADAVINGKQFKNLELVSNDNTRPIDGKTADADLRTPKVRPGTVTPSWSDLDTLLGNDTHYTKCVNTTLGINWTRDTPRFKKSEQAGHKTTMILASNVGDLEDATIRKIARVESPSIPDNARIVRVTGGFVNTYQQSCKPFVDNRPLIRAFIGVPTYDKRGRFTGVTNNGGVFHGCHNPWTIPGKITPTPSPSGSKSPSDTPSPSGSTTPPGTPGTSSPPPSTSTPPPNTKTPSKDPGARGNAGNGGGKNEDAGPGEYKPPSQMDPPPSKPRTNPPAPEPTKSKPPAVKPTPPSGGGSSATPTVDPGDDQNDGTVPTTGCGNPDFC